MISFYTRLQKIEKQLSKLVAAVGRVRHIGGTTPTGGRSGELQVGSNKIWFQDAGTWKSVAPGGGGGGSGAPDDATYLTTTANGTLINEVVVGTTPGGELGGTWASPTVDSVHSGSAHHTEDHGIVSSHHTSFPGGTTNFLRADGTFATPPGSGGGGLTNLDGGDAFSTYGSSSPIDGGGA